MAANDQSIEISKELYSLAQWTAEAEHRSIAEQIEFWARIGRAALDNSDLPIDFIRETLIAKAMDKSMGEPFIPE
ncbi:MAG: ParD-like family protein [Synergistaceae bacterium]|nr:ParD-like family protein [Synergistaceae bacterium]